MVYDQCHFYELNYYDLKSSANFEEAMRKVDFENTSISECTSWDFDDSIYKSTVVTDVS